MKKLPVVYLCLALILAALPAVSRADVTFYSLTGSFSYGLNHYRNVFELNSAGTIAVSLTSGAGDRIQYGLLISFDPLTGNQFDSREIGFGPLDVRLAETDRGTRVVVATSEGFGAAIQIFDMDSAGRFTFRARNQLSSSGVDYASNLALSPAGHVGFQMVNRALRFTDLVAFSLDDASEISRTTAMGPGDPFETLVIRETPGRRLLAYMNAVLNSPWHLIVSDVTDAATPVLAADVVLPRDPDGEGGSTPGIAITSDLRFAFATYAFSTFAVINIKKQTVVKSFTSWLDKMSLFENDSSTLVAFIGPRLTDQATAFSLVLVDATAPKKTHLINQIEMNYSVDPLADLQFSPTGNRLYVASEAGLTTLKVPSLSIVSHTALPAITEGRVHTIKTWGDPARALAAWGVFGAQYGLLQ